MTNHLFEFKAAIVVAVTAISAFLGWRGVLALAWVFSMAVDYVSGTAAACVAGQWESAAARRGLWHKAGMILVVIVAAVADGILSVAFENLGIGFTWPWVILPLVLAWYLITEFGSILENAVALGAKVPAWLVKLLKFGAKAIDDIGDKITAEAEEMTGGKENGSEH